MWGKRHVGGKLNHLEWAQLHMRAANSHSLSTIMNLTYAEKRLPHLHLRDLRVKSPWENETPTRTWCAHRRRYVCAYLKFNYDAVVDKWARNDECWLRVIWYFTAAPRQQQQWRLARQARLASMDPAEANRVIDWWRIKFVGDVSMMWRRERAEKNEY